MLKLEPVVLSIPTHRRPLSSWLNTLELVSNPDELVLVVGDDSFIDWEDAGPCADIELIDMDEVGKTTGKGVDSVYDRVILANVLGVTSDRPRMLQDAFRMLKPGGDLVAWNPALEDGLELYNLLIRIGVDTDPFVMKRLRNKDIASLRPEDACFLLDMAVYPNKGRLLKHLNEVEDYSLSEEQISHFPDRLAVNSFSVFMVWTKPAEEE